jgi:hypothetical protein
MRIVGIQLRSYYSFLDFTHFSSNMFQFAGTREKEKLDMATLFNHFVEPYPRTS